MKFLIVLVFLGFATVAVAQVAGSGNPGPSFLRKDLGIGGMGLGGGSTPVPPAGCVGAADFSDGCAIAVFGH